VSVGPRPVVFTFLRNFNDEFTGTTAKASKTFSVTLQGREGVNLMCKLPYKQSFISLGNYKSETSKILLLLSTVPIHMRTFIQKNKKRTEVWIIQCDNEMMGEMAFDGDIKVLQSHGSLHPTVRSVPISNSSVVSFGGHQGWCSLAYDDGSGGELLILALTGDDLYTFCPTFEESYWCSSGLSSPGLDPKRAEALRKAAGSNEAVSAAWGSYGIKFDPVEGYVDLEWRATDRCVYFLPNGHVDSTVSQTLQKAGFVRSDGLSELSPYSGFPGLYFRSKEQTYVAPTPHTRMARITGWQRRTTDFDSLDWKPLAVGPNFKPAKDTIDLSYTSGHVFYKVSFDSPEGVSSMSLTINVRHRCQVYINGKLLGGHTTYSLQLLRAGAKNGPDFAPHWFSYTIPKGMLNTDGKKNQIVLVIESYGLSRQAFSFNDVRSPRGLLGVKLEAVYTSALYLLSGGKYRSNCPFKLEATGVDVSTLSQVFAVCGFPDESCTSGWSDLVGQEGKVADGEEVGGGTLDRISGASVLQVDPSAEGRPTWYLGTMRLNPNTNPASISTSTVSAIGNAAKLAASNFILSLVKSETKPGPIYQTPRTPLRLHVSGPASAHIWIDGIYIARYHGNGDSVQKDFVIPESIGWKCQRIGATPQVKVLLYGRSAEENWVGLEVLGWENHNEVPGASLSHRWSGNLSEGGSVFSTLREIIRL
jgi:hypothetical protein